MNTARTRRVAAVGASVLVLSGCGTIGELMPGTDPFLEQSPRSIARAGFAEMREVTSVRVLGSMEDKKNGFTRIDLRLDDTTCTGSLDMRDGTVRVLKTDRGAWYSLDEKFWRSAVGNSSQGDKLVRQYASRWSVIGADDKALLKLCDLDAVVSGFTVNGDDAEESIEVGEVVKVGDADAVPVTGQDGKDRVTAWISVDAPHHVLKMAPARDTGRPDALYFEEFGAKVVAESPAKKDVVVFPTS
jgi:hypothetical protein